MPIYEYECEKCRFRFELKLRFSDADMDTTCPQCQSKVHRLFSPVPIIFKGSGFYVTDYRGSNSASRGSKPDKPKADKTCSAKASRES